MTENLLCFYQSLKPERREKDWQGTSEAHECSDGLSSWIVEIQNEM